MILVRIISKIRELDFKRFFFVEMITEDFPKSSIKTNFTSSTGTGVNKPSADTVDLTIDSDEDDDSLKKTVASKAHQKSKNNGM